MSLNPLLNNQILDWSKLKAFADYKINFTEKEKFFFGWIEKIAEKGETALRESAGN